MDKIAEAFGYIAASLEGGVRFEAYPHDHVWSQEAIALAHPILVKCQEYFSIPKGNHGRSVLDTLNSNRHQILRRLQARALANFWDVRYPGEKRPIEITIACMGVLWREDTTDEVEEVLEMLEDLLPSHLQSSWARRASEIRKEKKLRAELAEKERIAKMAEAKIKAEADEKVRQRQEQFRRDKEMKEREQHEALIQARTSELEELKSAIAIEEAFNGIRKHLLEEASWFNRWIRWYNWNCSQKKINKMNKEIKNCIDAIELSSNKLGRSNTTTLME